MNIGSDVGGVSGRIDRALIHVSQKATILVTDSGYAHSDKAIQKCFKNVQSIMKEVEEIGRKNAKTLTPGHKERIRNIQEKCMVALNQIEPKSKGMKIQAVVNGIQQLKRKIFPDRKPEDSIGMARVAFKETRTETLHKKPEDPIAVAQRTLRDIRAMPSGNILVDKLKNISTDIQQLEIIKKKFSEYTNTCKEYISQLETLAEGAKGQFLDEINSLKQELRRPLEDIDVPSALNRIFLPGDNILLSQLEGISERIKHLQGIKQARIDNQSVSKNQSVVFRKVLSGIERKLTALEPRLDALSTLIKRPSRRADEFDALERQITAKRDDIDYVRGRLDEMSPSNSQAIQDEIKELATIIDNLASRADELINGVQQKAKRK